MGTLLVTGGAGFIGSNFVRTVLASSPDRVVVLDKLTYAGSLLNLDGLLDDGRVCFVEGDIADRSRVSTLLDEHRPDALVNFAAESHVDRSIEAPGGFVHTNVVGTFELLEAARTWEGRPDAFRFLHVSTDEVYGSLGDEGAFTEKTAYAPNSPYAASKAAADHLCRAYHRTYGLPVILTNCSNNYGPYQFPEKLIPLMTLNAIEGKRLPVYGDGLHVRDWIFVEDHCRGILLALTRGRPGRAYNLGGASERTNLQVVDAICSALERRIPASENPHLAAAGVRRYDELKEFVPDRAGHDRRYAIDHGRASRELGFAPALDFGAGMERTVTWYVDNRSWCERIQQEGSYRRERLGL